MSSGNNYLRFISLLFLCFTGFSSVGATTDGLNSSPQQLYLPALVWFLAGLQLLRILYHFILSRYSGDSSLKWYVLHMLIICFAGAFTESVFYLLLPATSTLLIYFMLNIPVHFPKLKIVFTGIIVLSIVQGILYFFVPFSYVWPSHHYLFLFTEAFLVAFSLYAVYRKYPVNSVLLAAFFLTLTPFLFLNSTNNRALPVIYVVNIFEILLLSFVFGKIIRDRARERFNEEKSLLIKKMEEELDSRKTVFLTRLSEEFRAPLSVLLSTSDQLIEKYPEEELLLVMEQQGEAMLLHTNRLLNMSSLDAGQLKVQIKQADLSHFIRLFAGSFTSMAENKGITFEIKGPEKETKTWFDPEKLGIILENLLANAFKFTAAGGRVRVSFDHTQDLRSCIIKVSDTGRGIPAEDLKKIFDRYYQSGDTTKGTGIGLALVKELTTIIKGKIRVESKKMRVRYSASNSLSIRLPEKNTSPDNWKKSMRNSCLLRKMTRMKQSFQKALCYW